MVTTSLNKRKSLTEILNTLFGEFQFNGKSLPVDKDSAIKFVETASKKGMNDWQIALQLRVDGKPLTQYLTA
jgi:hypothetical protein